MSVPQVQLTAAARLAYFEPTVSQYLHKLEQAVSARNLAAARDALGRLEKMVPTSSLSSTAGDEASVRIVSHLQDVGRALQLADMTKAAEALDPLRRLLTNIPPESQSDSEEPEQEQSSDQDGSVRGSASDSRSQVNFRA